MYQINKLTVMKGILQVQAAKRAVERAQWERESPAILAEMQRIESTSNAIANEALWQEYQLLKERKILLAGALEMDKASLELANMLAPLLVRSYE
jgi:hypothetical protein